MVTPPPLKFINQTLRRRSFQGQDLNAAVFVRCDLRGCTFRGADLRQASFVQCQVGASPKARAIAVGSMVSVSLLTFHAVSTMVFSALGSSPENPAWPYVLTLYGALAITTLGVGADSFWRWGRQGAALGMGMGSGALLGFFYGGRLTGDNPGFAIAGAVLGGLLGGWIAAGSRSNLVRAGVLLAGAIAAYGLTFGLWTMASSYLMLGKFMPGCLWGVLAWLCLNSCLGGLWQGLRAAKFHGVTSFRHAQLAGCTFKETPLSRCDVTAATGL